VVKLLAFHLLFGGQVALAVLSFVEIPILQTKELEVDDTALQIPSCGGQLLKV